MNGVCILYTVQYSSDESTVSLPQTGIFYGFSHHPLSPPNTNSRSNSQGKNSASKKGLRGGEVECEGLRVVEWRVV